MRGAARLSPAVALLAAMGGPLVAPGCAPPQVSFLCEEGEPLCDLVEIMNDDRPEATGIDIDSVYLYQAVEIPLMENLIASGSPEVPIVAGRYALVRVFVEPHEDFEVRDLTGRFFLHRDGQPFAAYQVDNHINGASDASVQESTFNFLVPGEVILPEVSWSAAVVEVDRSSGGTEAEGYSSWPDNDTELLEVTEGADLLRILLIPVQYDADGSGRLPDTSDSTVELYRDYMYAHYAAAEVEVLVGDELPWSQTVSASGSGWDGLLSAVGEARGSQDLAEDDMYMYGVFNPDDDFGSFCSGGCVTGLSNMAGSASDSWSRASIGLGYGGGTSASTMVHEVGHAHGLWHINGGCGSSGWDDNYPSDDAHANGYIGVRGYDWRSDSLIEPDGAQDYMTYCDPTWASDYHYDKTHTRVKGISDMYYARGTPRPYWGLWVMADGSMSWGRDHTLSFPLDSPTRKVELLDSMGHPVSVVDGWFSPFSDLPGGRLTIAAPGPGVTALRFEGRVSPPR